MNTDNFDRMKEAWGNMGKGIGEQRNDNCPAHCVGMKTSLDRLRDRYRRFWILSLCLALTTYMTFWRNDDIAADLRLPLGITYAVYFLIVFVMDYWLWRGVGRIDPLTMGVSEVVGMSLFYRKRHLQFIAILIPLAIGLVGFTAYAYSFEKYVIYGMITGGVIGAAIGSIQLRRFMADYRRIAQ